MRKGFIALAVIGVALAAVSIFFLLSSNAPSEPIALDENEVAMELAFLNYIGRYQKGYATKEEFLKRKEIFMATMRKVQEHNAKEDSSYTLGINKYADWTKEDRQRMKGYKLQDRSKEGRVGSLIEFETTNLKATIDWRTKGWVTPVKDQGRCGSCYAFSAVGALEGQFKNLTGNITNLSIQQVVDCSKSFLNDGCEGGIPDWVYDYIMYNGLETDKDYPYIDNEGSCNADLRKYVVGISDYKDVTPKSPNQLKAALNFVGPISVAVGTGEYEAFDWFEY